MGIKLESNDFIRVLTIVAVMAFIMVSVAYGITYMFEGGSIKLPIEPQYILFIFSIGFVILSVFFEKVRDAIYPYSLMGGAIASAILAFIIIAAIGGMRYILSNGFKLLNSETWIYSLSICIILSMILFNLIKHKF
ncbi:MAG: heat-shock protein [Candidatus Methanoperedens sp.]|nr:heat-shock protein [Candidatus Methanoperedens sp.]